MNPIERIFTSIIQSFLRIAMELIKGLFGANAQENDTTNTDEPLTPTNNAPLEIEQHDA